MSEISVILPAYNEERSIGKTLDSLLRQTRVPDEIVVGDGGSADATRAIVEGFRSRGAPVRIVDNPARRVGAGRNSAIAASRGPIVACIDAGNTADSAWLQRLTESLDGPDAVAVGTIRPRPESSFQACVAAIVYGYLLEAGPSSRKPPEQDLLSSSSIAYPRSVWERAGGYPEWLEAGEDKLFATKLRSIGVQVIRRPDAVVYHHMRGDPISLFRQIHRYGRGSGLSGQTPLVVALLAFRYAVLAALAAAMLLVPSPAVSAGAGALAAGGALAHLFRHGYGALRRCGVGLTPSTLAMAPVVLAASNLGSITGHARGNLERWVRPAARRLVKEYMVRWS